MFEKKGQAALEFLMTYGWAILAAIVVIGVLAYFGVFSPGRYIPEACGPMTSPLGLSPGDCQISAANGISLALLNGAGVTITVLKVNITNCGDTGINLTDIGDGTKGVLPITCSPLLTQGEKFNGNIEVTYKRAGGIFNETSTGRVTGTVKA